ncbi:MAG: 23S rRNA (adenine(2503)-C(2))-methyltransferase RlmN [Bacilli bacterium]|nr:23S rRNA (adenine(2503)-C(2))-methyltransferase RlmN [Bacilli bacterium]
MILTNLTRQKLIDDLLTLNEKAFRSTQLFEWVYKQQVFDWEKMTNISKTTLEVLKNQYQLPHLKVETIQQSSDGTKKYLFELTDGNFIEAVLMHYNYGESVCISTQVGCNMGCAFCASGLNKKKRNLEVWEMVMQVVQIDHALKEEGKRLSHVVIMGIGEPFDNYDNVIDFIQIINDGKGLGIGARHITVSTCGIVPKIKCFSDLPLQVNLAISLHFANDTLRSQYMPINRSYPLSELLPTLEQYYQKTNRRITFEYILIADINDSASQARDLLQLVKPFNSYVNLIPMNETGGVFKRSSRERMNHFFNVLAENGINVTLRREQGHDIDAACGQLRIKREEKNDRNHHQSD